MEYVKLFTRVATYLRNLFIACGVCISGCGYHVVRVLCYAVHHGGTGPRPNIHLNMSVQQKLIKKMLVEIM